MPPYLENIEGWKSLWPIFVFVAALATGVTYVAGKKGQRKELFLVLLAFSMLGMTTGYLTGFSRESAVGAVLPAVLSLMGGLLVFLVGQNKESRGVVSMSMFIFAVTLLIGTGWGAIMRDTYEKFQKSELYLQQEAFIESEVNKFRKSRDLPPLGQEKNAKGKK